MEIKQKNAIKAEYWKKFPMKYSTKIPNGWEVEF